MGCRAEALSNDTDRTHRLHRLHAGMAEEQGAASLVCLWICEIWGHWEGVVEEHPAVLRRVAGEVQLEQED
jgi:hypothetical protein